MKKNSTKQKSKGRSKSFIIIWLTYVAVCLVFSLVLFFILSGERLFQLAPQVYFEEEETTTPDQNIKIKFDQPVRRRGIEESFRVTPELKGEIIWEDNNTGFEYVTKQLMKAGENYVIAFLGENRFWIPFKAVKEIHIKEKPVLERVSPFKDQGIKTDEKIFFKFNESLQNYVLKTEINPEITYKIDTNEERSEFVLVPEGNLANNQTYTVKAYLSYNSPKAGMEKELVKELSFSTLAPLNFVSVYPKNGTKDISTKQKFTLSFDKPVNLESFRESLNFSPPALYQIKPSTNLKTLVIYPEGLNQNTDYLLEIKKGLKAQDESYLEKEEIIHFKTGNVGGIIYDERRSTEDPLIKDGKYIDVNLNKQLLGIYSDGMVLGTYRISSGKSGMRTPVGRFSVFRKERKHWSRKYKLWMPYSLQFTGAGHFIHELPEWPNGYKEGANHLGIPVSHGCVRLGVGSAETVFNFSDIGTPIYIHY